MDLKSAIFDLKVLQYNSKGYELDIPGIEKMSPVKIVKMICEGTLNNIETLHGRDEFRFQTWTFIERNKTIDRIIKETCSNAVKAISNLLMSVKNISKEEAEVRASILLLSVDSYNQLRWRYIDGLKIKSSKSKFLENYKQYIIHDLTESIFK